MSIVLSKTTLNVKIGLELLGYTHVSVDYPTMIVMLSPNKIWQVCLYTNSYMIGNLITYNILEERPIIQDSLQEILMFTGNHKYHE